MPPSCNFTGQRLDSQTGLLYYIFRYYDSFSGRFLRADTMENNARGMDPYAYVGDNRETKNDPTGHWGSLFDWATAIAVTAVVAAVVLVAVAASPILVGIAAGVALGYAAAVATSFLLNGLPRTQHDWDTLGKDAFIGEVLGGLGGGYNGVGAVVAAEDEVETYWLGLATQRAIDNASA